MPMQAQQSKMWEDRIKEMANKARQSMEEGAVTSGYKANRDEVISLLNRAIASEWLALMQYWHHYFMATDIHSSEIKETFKKFADQELEHIDEIGSRIQLLGGVPADKPDEIVRLWPNPVDYGHDLRSMMEEDLIDERVTIDFYSEIVRYCGSDDIVTRTLFEHILEEEHDHADTWSNLLYQLDASSNKRMSTIHEEVVGQAGRRQVRAA